VNLSVTFSSIAITITSLEKMGNVMRVHLKEANTTGKHVGYIYNDVAHLITPDGSSLPLKNYQFFGPPGAQATQTNWLDFEVPANTATDGLLLRLGSQGQAQMDIPLKEHADISQYQPQTSTPNKSTVYGIESWTITQATCTWSSGGAQAREGMRYVTLQLTIASTQDTIGVYWGDYVRLKAGQTIARPTLDATIPLAFTAGSTVKAQASFEVPLESTSFTFLLLERKDFQQATIDFQIA
jgi:hypothetical protein